MNFVRGALSGRRRAALRDRHRRAGRRTCGRDHRPHPPERSADAGGGQQDRPLDAGGARSARREVARDAARRRNHTDLGQGRIQHRRPVRPDSGAATRRRTLLPEGYAHGQDAAFLRLGDHPRKDPAQLRQGDPLQLRNRDRGVPRGVRHRPHFGRDLRGAQLAEGNPHRAQGREAQKVGRQAREELEEFLRKKVFLQLFVKVSEDWRNDQRQLRRFGYDPQ